MKIFLKIIWTLLTIGGVFFVGVLIIAIITW